MSVLITCYRIFLASPSGLDDERRTVRKVVEEFDELTALPRHVLFKVVGWENVPPGYGRPQGKINVELKSCDYFVMLLWDKWGSPPDIDGRAQFSSGTHEEFETASRSLEDKRLPMRDVLVLFKNVSPNQLQDPGENLMKVIAFKTELDKKKTNFYHTFDDHQVLADKLRVLLNRWLIDHEQSRSGTSHDLSQPLSPAPSSANPVAATNPQVDRKVSTSNVNELSATPESLEARGDELLSSGRFSEAYSVFEEILSSAARHDTKWEVVAYRGFGRVLLRRGELAQAEKQFRTALRIARTLKKTDVVAEQLKFIAQIHYLRDEFVQAKPGLLEAERIYHKQRHRDGLADVTNLLGLVYLGRGDHIEAEKCFRASHKIYQDLNRPEGLANTLNNLGLVNAIQGDSTAAEQQFRQALKINTDSYRNDAAALNLLNLGKLLQAKGDLAGARRHFDQSIDLYNKIGLTEEAAKVRFLLDTLSRAQTV